MTREELARVLGVTPESSYAAHEVLHMGKICACCRMRNIDDNQERARCIWCGAGLAKDKPWTLMCTLTDPAIPHADCNDWLQFAVPWLGERCVAFALECVCDGRRGWRVAGFGNPICAATPGRAALAAVEAVEAINKEVE